MTYWDRACVEHIHRWYALKFVSKLVIPDPPLDFACLMKVSSIVLSTSHLLPGTKDLATLNVPDLMSSDEPGCDCLTLARNTEKYVRYLA